MTAELDDFAIDEAADHRHQWVISREVFWSEHGGDYRLMWCEVCDEPPPPRRFPIELAEEAGAVTLATPLSGVGPAR